MATAKAQVKVREFTNEPLTDFSNADNRRKMEKALKKVAGVRIPEGALTRSE